MLSLAAIAWLLAGIHLEPLPPQPPGVAWPTDVWPMEDRRNDALAQVVAKAFVDPDPERPLRTHAVLVVHRGRLVAEAYGAGISADMPLPGWSVAKTVTAALTGILAGDERLTLDSPVGVPEWSGADPRAELTLDHLLRMRSGLLWSEEYVRPTASNVLSMLFGSGRHDMAAYVERQPLAAIPGTGFAYSSGSSLVVSRALRRAFADDLDAYHAFPRRELFDPVGMSSAVLEVDGAGTFVGSSYFFATARDFAKFGLLLLRGGQWDGREVLPEGYVDYMRTPTRVSQGRYGAGLWLNAADPVVGAPPAMLTIPTDLFYAWGKDGQYVAMVPSRDVVVVRLGVTPEDGRWYLERFLAEVLAVLPR